MRSALLGFGLLLVATAAQAQSATDVERCFQNPASCANRAAPSPPPPPPSGGGVAVTRPPTPDYASVLQQPDAERKRIQESLRTLDKYNGPIDGNLQSDGTAKAIADWQKGRGAAATGKLTPDEVQALHADAAKAPIKRIEPPAQATAPPPPKLPSNAELLKALQVKLTERRKAAEPKAEAAAQALARDLKAYVAAEGKTGVVGDQFDYFSKWFADTLSAGRSVGEIVPSIDDFGEVKGASAVVAEVHFELSQGMKTSSQCLVFAWVDPGPAKPRGNARSFACDDVGGVEKWKSEQQLSSAWR